MTIYITQLQITNEANLNVIDYLENIIQITKLYVLRRKTELVCTHAEKSDEQFSQTITKVGNARS